MNWLEAVERTVTALGYDLVDTERSAGGLLRVSIDRIPGKVYDTGVGEFITVDDCEKVTRQLQHVLEVETAPYERLEVSSPGLDRPLKREGDYQRFVGEQVALTLKLPFQGRKKYQGVLERGDGEGEWRVVLEVEQGAGKKVGGDKGKSRLKALPQNTSPRSNAAAPAVAAPPVEGSFVGASEGTSAGAPSVGAPSAGVPSVGVPSVGVPSVGVPSVGAPSGAIPSKAASPAQTPQQAQALTFTLAEVREARLIPVLDFKGRRFAADVPQTPSANEPVTGDQVDGGRDK